MFLETQRLYLREMTEADFDALYKVLADSDIMQHYPYTFDENRVKNWIVRNIERYRIFGFGLWAVCLKDTGEMIGDCGLTMQIINGHIKPEIGYHIRADQRRKGFAREAAIAVRDWAFRNTPFRVIYSYMKYTNVPSYKTAMSYGCKQVDEFHDDANEITKVFAITKEEWKNQAAGANRGASETDKGIRLCLLEETDREQFISDNQEAFNYGAMEEFGCRDDHFEEDGQIISRETIEQSVDQGEAYRILLNGKKAGGVVIRVDEEKGNLELLFVSPNVHSKGIGYAAWCQIEKLHPEVKIWETVTPYFEQRNIHFYVNKCGFHIVEFFNQHHPDPNDPEMDAGEMDGMFRLEKRMD